MSVHEARWKAIRSPRTSGGRPGPELHGCVRTSCISTSNARTRISPRWRVERAQELGTPDSGVEQSPAVASSGLGILPCCNRIRREHSTLSHRRSRFRAVMKSVDSPHVRLSTYKMGSSHGLFWPYTGTFTVGLAVQQHPVALTGKALQGFAVTCRPRKWPKVRCC
jgi:hypothetical protein